MEKYKKAITLLISALLALQAGITAAAAEQVIFSDDFDSYDNLYAMSDRWNLKECYEYCTVRGGALHVKNRDGGAPVLCMPEGTVSKKITSGHVKITMDILIENLGGTTCGIMSLVPEGVHDYGRYRVMEFYRDKEITCIRDSYYPENYVEIKPSKWYSIEGDFYPGEESRFDIAVYDADGNRLGGYSREKENCEGFLVDFTNINFTSWSDRDYAVDNLKITYSEE